MSNRRKTKKKKPSTEWKALRSLDGPRSTKELVASDHQKYDSAAHDEAKAEPKRGVVLVSQHELGKRLSDGGSDPIEHVTLLLARERRESGRLDCRLACADEKEL